MTTTAPAITGARYDTVTRAALLAALSGDWRARRVTIAGRSGIITPHRTSGGALDRDDLAAQIWAICHDLPSTTGRYTSGIFASTAGGHYVAAPLLDEPLFDDPLPDDPS